MLSYRTTPLTGQREEVGPLNRVHVLSMCTVFTVDATTRCNMDEQISLANQESKIGINSRLQEPASQ